MCILVSAILFTHRVDIASAVHLFSIYLGLNVAHGFAANKILIGVTRMDMVHWDLKCLKVVYLDDLALGLLKLCRLRCHCHQPRRAEGNKKQLLFSLQAPDRLVEMLS